MDGNDRETQSVLEKELKNATRSDNDDKTNGSKNESIVCMWKNCGLVFDNAEVLYHHLCDDHVGRISKNNLCLTCHWDECNANYGKRDHITSHIRIHIPLKQFSCATCGKCFKRSQDLKKHQRTHKNKQNQSSDTVPRIAEFTHQAQEETQTTLLTCGKPSPSPVDVPDCISTPAFSSQSSCDSLSPWSSPNSLRQGSNGTPAHIDSGLPSLQLRTEEQIYPSLPRWTPGHDTHSFMRAPEFVPTQDTAYDVRSHGNENSKRPRSSVDEFWGDVQRKKMAPTYDHSMMERLDHLWVPQDHNLSDLDNFLNDSVDAINGMNSLLDPRSASGLNPVNSNLVDINAWLLQLGDSMSRELSSTQMRPHNFAQSLSQYGLANIPGADLVFPQMHTMPENVEHSWVNNGYGVGGMLSYPQQQDKGFNPAYRNAKPLTRMPPPVQYEDVMDEECSTPRASQISVYDQGRGDSFSGHGTFYPSLPRIKEDGQTITTPLKLKRPSNTDQVRKHHMILIVNLLMALNKNKCIHPETGHVLPLRRMPVRRRSDSRNWPSSLPPLSSSSMSSMTPKPLYTQIGSSTGRRPFNTTRETRPGSLPSIAQLLSDVNMD